MTERIDNPAREPLSDEQALDEYLKGGSLASKHYHEIADDAVPPELDERVLSMARSAAERPQKSRVWVRWTAPLAVAASAVVVLSIVLDQGAREQAAVTVLDGEHAESEAPAEHRAIEEVGAAPQVESRKASSPENAGPRANAPLPAYVEPQVKSEPLFNPPREFSPAASASSAVDSGRGQEQARELRKRSEREGASARRSDAAPAPAERDEVTVSGRSTAAQPPESTEITADRAMNAPQVAAAYAAHSNPESWLEEIRVLREQGRNEEADREWDSFRKAYPDYDVTEPDLAGKKTGTKAEE